MIKIDQALFTGLGFGATSGVITTLGLIVGLETLTNSISTALAGIYIIAFCDGLSDALGIHLSQESNKKIENNEVWASTIYTLIFKILIALSFTVPLLIMPNFNGVIVCIIWGYFLLGLLSFVIAKRKNESPFGIIFEHWMIMTFILLITYFIGMYVK